MASLARWTWVWVYSGSWRWTGRPGLLRFMESQRVRHNLATELNWIWFRWHLDKTWDLELMMEWLRCLDVVIGHMYFAYENVNFRGLESGVLWAGLCILKLHMSFPSGNSGKELTCQGRRHETQIWFLGWKDPLEKEMATHSSIVAWWSPGTEKPGGLQSIGSQRIIHDWSNLANFVWNPSPLFHKTWLLLFSRSIVFWRRKWQPTPVFLPGESHGQGSLAWDCHESDTT